MFVGMVSDSIPQGITCVTPKQRKYELFRMALQFLWRFFTVAARVIALALFAARFKRWVFIFVASHWMTMFCWIRFMQTKFCDTRVEELGLIWYLLQFTFSAF